MMPITSSSLKLFEDFQFDTVAKILEMEAYHNREGRLSEHWCKLFSGVRAESERINAHWQMNDPSTYTAHFRDKLRAKYGDNPKVTIPKE